MTSRLTSRPRSDSCPHPPSIPGRSTKVHSLIAFYNQKALQQTVVTSGPYCDRNKIPSDKVKPLVQSFTKAVSSNNSSRRGSGIWILGDGVISVALRGQLELPSNEDPEDSREIACSCTRKTASTGLRSVKSWKSARGWDRRSEKSTTKPGVDEPVARRSTRRKKKESSTRASIKSIDSSVEATVSPQSEMQCLATLRPKKLESETTGSSSLEVEISTSPGDVIGDGNTVQTSESSAKRYIEQGVTKDEIKATGIEQKIPASKLPPAISKFSGSWKGAFQSVRDSFKRKPAATESTISAKVFEESVAAYKPKALKSTPDNMTPDSQATGYITPPDTFGASKNPISVVQTQINKLNTLGALASRAEDENTLSSDHEQKKSALGVYSAFQEVSDSSLSQTVEDLNTIPGVGEMAAWDNTILTRNHSPTFPKQRTKRMPVADDFQPPSPVLRRESLLKQVSPLRFIKERAQTSTLGTNERTITSNSLKSEPDQLLTHASIDTPTSFGELSLLSSLDPLSDIQKKMILVGKRTPVAIVQLSFESLSSLATPPPANPLQEVRSPTLIREMAFPALRLRDEEQDAGATVKKRPALKYKVAVEHISVPKKIIYGGADWRTDRRVGGSNNVDKTTEKLQGDESTPGSYDGQRISSAPETQEPEFTALPRIVLFLS